MELNTWMQQAYPALTLVASPEYACLLSRAQCLLGGGVIGVTVPLCFHVPVMFIPEHHGGSSS